MRIPMPSWIRGRVLILPALLSALLVAACTEPASTICPTGVVCPPGLECAANQPVCITNLCGNGVTDPGEMCDDGNIIDGDGCNHDCTSNEKCGNGVVDTLEGEVCDPPLFGKCSVDCKSTEACGNHIIDKDAG